jgi:hyperosmotically inducible periplasmic protein
MKTFVTVALLAAAAAACDRGDSTSTATTTSSTVQASDNTGTNARDRAGAVTPLDQGNSAADLETTQAIRKAVMADDTLSTDAKNVKIVTDRGMVTLRGSVKDQAEKDTIDRNARAAAGSNQVNDQLDVHQVDVKEVP